MNTIIISDISGEQQSIIPYSLKFARAITNKLKVLHIVDPRLYQAANSSFADSQSFHPGEKMSHIHILEREKKYAEIKLDTLLSREASRLNYPLRVYPEVVVSSLSNEIQKEAKVDPPLFAFISSDPCGEVLLNLKEYFDFINKKNSFTLIVPPGEKYPANINALLLFDFNKNNNENVFQIFQMLNKFNMLMTVTDVASKDNYTNLELKRSIWSQAANNYLNTPPNVQSHILEGDDVIETIENYFKRNNYNLLIIPHDYKTTNNWLPSSKSVEEDILHKLACPVLMY